MKLEIVPCLHREAKAFVRKHHRHHRPPRGMIFCVAAALEDRIVGVAICGRPVSRILQDGYTVEILRVCSDGTRNCCSLLYGACRRAAKALGYRRVITYTLPEEGGASLRAAGFTLTGKTEGGSWSRPSRPRADNAPLDEKYRWELIS